MGADRVEDCVEFLDKSREEVYQILRKALAGMSDNYDTFVACIKRLEYDDNDQ